MTKKGLGSKRRLVAKGKNGTGGNGLEGKKTNNGGQQSDVGEGGGV